MIANTRTTQTFQLWHCHHAAKKELFPVQREVNCFMVDNMCVFLSVNLSICFNVCKC